MKVEISRNEAAAIIEALKESRFIFINRAWVGSIIKRIKEEAKKEATAAVFFAALMGGPLVLPCFAAQVSLQEIAAKVSEQIAAKIAQVGARTNRVDALASPENYALLKSTRLADAARKLALQKQLAEAALADANETEASRLKWHGAYSSQSINWENLTATFYHADGYAVSTKFQKPNLEAEAKKAVANLPKLATTNGVPVKLAEARARRNAEKSQPVVSVTEEIHANRAERPE